MGPCLSQVWSPPLGGWGWAQDGAGLLAGGEGGIDGLLDPGLLLTPWWVGCILSLLVDRAGPGVAEGSGSSGSWPVGGQDWVPSAALWSRVFQDWCLWAGGWAGS